MTTPDERTFVTFTRGQIRDDALATFRNGLRALVNPDTGQIFTEDEIRFSTQPGSRIYLRWDAIDLLGQAFQTRARLTAQNGDPRLAVSSWLRSVWGELWLPDGTLPATSSEGDVSWNAPAGKTFVGSTTLGDPAAFTARDPAGNLYQAKFTVGPTLSDGVVTITLIAVNGGAVNPLSPTVFTASTNIPAGVDPSGTASTDFEGGFNAENDADFLSRLIDVIQFRPGSGNAPQFRAWARASNTGVESAWVYSSALHANTVLVAITRKRGANVGPNGRVADGLLLGKVRGYLTPPGSPVVPSRPFVIVQTVTPDPVDLSMTLSMRKNTPGGWADPVPWPTPILVGGDDISSFCRVLTIISPTSFTIFSNASLPNGAGFLTGVNSPSLMVWNRITSSFEQINVTSVADAGSGIFLVNIANPPSFTIAVNMVICPFSALAIGENLQSLGPITQGVQDYFDSLGPGEVVDLNNDPRGAWAYRWPEPNTEAPSEAGQAIVTTMFDDLGQAIAGAQVAFISHTIPNIPIDMTLAGPSVITINDFGVYSQ